MWVDGGQMDQLTTQTSQQYKRSYTLTFIDASIIHHNRRECYHEQKHNEAQKIILYISNIYICTNVTLHYIYLFYPKFTLKS